METEQKLPIYFAGEDREHPVLPTLIIRPHSPAEELKYLWHVLKRIPFYQEHGYTFEIPNHRRFQELARVSPRYEDVDHEEIRKVFETEVYNSNFYIRGVEILESRRAEITSAFPKFSEMRRNWGFKIPPTYTILLTRYGPGGYFDETTGEVVMLTRDDGSSKIDLVHNVVQEMIHIGVEEDIVRKNRLTHSEKERLVDLISIKGFPDIFKGFNLQQVGDSRIDTYITDEATINNIPLAVKNFIKDFPRG